MLFHFNENIYELCLHLNIMYVCLLFYIVDDLVCRVRRIEDQIIGSCGI